MLFYRKLRYENCQTEVLGDVAYTDLIRDKCIYYSTKRGSKNMCNLEYNNDRKKSLFTFISIYTYRYKTFCICYKYPALSSKVNQQVLELNQCYFI